MTDQTVINIEVVYALPDEQILVPLSLSRGVTVEEAIRQSGLMDKFPEIDLAANKVGIWNKASELTAVLRDKDRVEIYRPLIADPKEVRRKRAEEGKAMKKGGGELQKE